ncbi:GNAT family N-acetyltransferase [Stakelama pacifica]|uniref:Putative acetyltransferase n=1 Tax=Stakelama pacifica TaxID=517720 RepID=A0A4R6FEY0_9SPHN|nr:GNAT family N-acetyltransferase [Stakelama pacifica]TDN79260.1 putative acetyltransferase [Stakelama pacifica]GGO98582.1 putative N-acetyltransferase YedL [Stakelama pacifica]
MRIVEGGLDDPQVQALLELHAAGMLAHSPRDSCHFLDLSGLRIPSVTFWTVWDGDVVAGCGALKALDAAHGEIKSMRTHPDHLRRGVGAMLLTHIIATARARGYQRLSLETGSGASFEPAHKLYRAAGFTDCAAFGDYKDGDPFSRFLTLTL